MTIKPYLYAGIAILIGGLVTTIAIQQSRITSANAKSDKLSQELSDANALLGASKEHAVRLEGALGEREKALVAFQEQAKAAMSAVNKLRGTDQDRDISPLLKTYTDALKGGK